MDIIPQTGCLRFLVWIYIYIEICKSSKCVFPWVFSTCSDKPRPNPTSPKSSQCGESLDFDGGKNLLHPPWFTMVSGGCLILESHSSIVHEIPLNPSKSHINPTHQLLNPINLPLNPINLPLNPI